ncbi:MAG: SRPBCC domain-containing protein [Alphaproteobacteria bacterium]|nr:SRPBCC domain-containing protein [Alphaproteobacteria bacterium]
MSTRSQWHEIELAVTPVALFNFLIAMKPIRGRWGSVSAVAMDLDGVYLVAWGPRENDPDFVAGTRMKSFESPRRVLLAYDYCRGKSGALPFGAGMSAEFTIQKTPAGALLRVTHAGIPQGPEADAYFQSAGEGWRSLLQGIGTLLAPPPPPPPRR